MSTAIVYTGSITHLSGNNVSHLCGPCGCPTCRERDDRRESGFTCEDSLCGGHPDDRFAAFVESPAGDVYLTHIRRTSLTGL